MSGRVCLGKRESFAQKLFQSRTPESRIKRVCDDSIVGVCPSTSLRVQIHKNHHHHSGGNSRKLSISRGSVAAIYQLGS